jgi:predicted O-methyltransferase YrrM
VSHKIEVRLAKAAASMQNLLDTEGEGSFDLIFIDADKASKLSLF